MAPKKRKDIIDNNDTDAGASNIDVAASQGQAQPSSMLSITPTPEPEAQQPHAPQDDEDFVASTIRDDNKSENNAGVEATFQAAQDLTADDLDDMSIEELELALEATELELKMLQTRQAILKKKRKHNTGSFRAATERQFTPNSPSPRASAPPVAFRQGAILEDMAVPESNSVRRKHQDERLRRAGLLPSRASEVSPAHSLAPLHTTRPPSIPNTTIFTGIDRKFAVIMNSSQRVPHILPGDKSELSRAGIKMHAPEKWNGDRSLQAFTDWVHSVAHYFKIHSPLSEILKVNLLGGYLSGDPLDWYWRYVAPTSSQWSAADVIVALRRHFLVDELSRQAADDFESAKQDDQDIHAFQAYLLKLADQMAEYPSPIALNRRLLKGMKHSTSSAIIANRDIDAEVSSWEEIVQASMDQERALRYANSLKGATTTPQIERKDLDTKQKDTHDRAPFVYASNRNKEHSGTPAVHAPTTRPTTYIGVRNTSAPHMRSTGPKPTDQCRVCSEYGHWASSCPKRVSTHMIQVDDDEDQETEEQDDPDLQFYDSYLEED